jgi:uncharacterized protein YuzE
VGKYLVEFDPNSDALYVEFLPDVEVVRTEEVDDLRNVDYSESGDVVGVEFLGVSGGIDLSGIPRADDIVEALAEADLDVARRASNPR